MTDKNLKFKLEGYKPKWHYVGPRCCILQPKCEKEFGKTCEEMFGSKDCDSFKIASDHERTYRHHNEYYISIGRPEEVIKWDCPYKTLVRGGDTK